MIELYLHGRLIGSCMWSIQHVHSITSVRSYDVFEQRISVLYIVTEV